jgi:hypothetical protein
MTSCSVSRYLLLPSFGPGYLSRYSDSLLAGRSGIESRRGRDFPHPSRPAWGPPNVLYIGYRVKQPGRVVDHPRQSGAEVKERVQLYLYSPLWAFLAYSRVTFTFISDVCIGTHVEFPWIHSPSHLPPTVSLRHAAYCPIYLFIRLAQRCTDFPEI